MICNLPMETEFRRYIRDLLEKSGFFSISVEHRSGGSVGAPDLLVLVGWLLLPVELKVGEYDARAELVRCERIRPAQIKLMDALILAGGRVRLLIGVQDFRGWQAYLLRDCSRTSLLRKGYGMRDLVRVARGTDLQMMPDRW